MILMATSLACGTAQTKLVWVFRCRLQSINHSLGPGYGRLCRGVPLISIQMGGPNILAMFGKYHQH